MQKHTLVVVGALVGALATGCTDAAPTAGSDGVVAAGPGNGTKLRVTGDGEYNAGVIVNFEMNAIVHGSGNVSGSFRHTTALGGFPIEFIGTVTCVVSDPATKRAWIGGVITANNSTHAGFTTPIHAVGRDIWFRVVDYGNGGSGTADRTTFVGFEGGAGIITSAEYCATRPWPDDDARTNALTSGNLRVN